jgi:hypothetical protein
LEEFKVKQSIKKRRAEEKRTQHEQSDIEFNQTLTGLLQAQGLHQELNELLAPGQD